MNNIIIVIISIILQLVASYEIGDLSGNALEYTTSRGDAFKDAFIILICIVFRYVLDRVLLKNCIKERAEAESGEGNKPGFSPIVLDIVSFVLGTIFLILFLSLYGKEDISVTLAVMLISFVLMLLFEKDKYIYRDAFLDKVVEIQDDAEGEGRDIEVSASEGEGHDIEVSASEEEGHDIEASDSEEKKLDSDVVDDEEENYKKVKSGNHRIITQTAYVFAGIAMLLLGVLSLGDVQSRHFGGLYFLLLFLFSALSVLFRFINRAFAASMDEDLDDDEKGKMFFGGFKTKDEMLECIILSVFTALFLSHRSVLAAFVFLLGVAAMKVVIPAIFDNWGRGGSKVVAMNKELVARLVARIVSLVIIMIAVWFLSFGAVWEIEYLSMIGVALFIMML